MPHLIVEYSANLDSRVDLSALVQTVHAAALATGVFPEKGTRTRTARREQYRIADGHPDNAFVHLVIRIGHGRSPETKKRVGTAVFEALCDALAADQAKQPLAISCEIQELDPELNWRRNNLPDWIRKRSEPA